MLRHTPGSGRPQKLYLTGLVKPEDDGVLMMQYQASEAQRTPLKATVEHCQLDYDYSRQDTGSIYMSRINKNQDANKKCTLRFQKIMKMLPRDVVASFDTQIMTSKAFKDMRIKPSLTYDEELSIFKLVLPGYVTLSQEAPYHPTVPFLCALNMSGSLSKGYECVNITPRPRTLTSYKMPKNEPIGETANSLLMKLIIEEDPEVESTKFEEDCAVDITFTEQRYSRTAISTLELSELPNMDSRNVQVALNKCFDEMLEDLNLPEQVIAVENGSVGRKKMSMGHVYVEFSDNLANFLDASVDSAVINLFNTSIVGSTIELGYFSGSRIPDLETYFPVCLLGSGLSTESLTYVEGLGYTNVVGRMTSNKVLNYVNEFILTSPRGYMTFRLVDKQMKPLVLKFAVRVSMIVTLRDSELQSRM